MSTPVLSALRKAAPYLLAAVALGALAALIALESILVGYPKMPDPQHGLIVAQRIKGVVVYITPQEAGLLRWSWIVLGVSATPILAHMLWSAIRDPAGFYDWKRRRRL